MSEDTGGLEDWRYKAKCRGMCTSPETDAWFPPRDKEKYRAIATVSKAVCFGKDGLPECPVRKECILYADKMDEQHGIWGGLSHRERNALQRRAEKSGKTLREWVLTQDV